MMLIDLIKANRSYRGYDHSRTVTKDELLKMVEAARLCPSSVNMQPLRYFLTCDPTTVATIHDEFCTATPSADPSDLLAIQHTDLLESLRSSFTTTTLIDPSATLPASTSKKTQRDYTSLCNLLEEILDCLDMENICSN